MANIFSNLDIVGKSMIVLLIVLLFILIGLIIYLCVKNKKQEELNMDLDFFDELKKDNDNSKSVFVDDIDSKKINEVAKKIEIEPEIKSVTKEDIEPKVDEKKFDISEVAKQMEEDIEKTNIELTEFEMEQEEKSIISYEELLQKVKRDNANSKVKVNLQTVKLEEPKKEEFTFNTEVLDFGELSEVGDAPFKVSTPVSPVDGIQNTSTNLLKQEDIKSVLDIENVDTSIYSSDEFLNALKELRDSLD
ncbi:MAG: hypothetical protein IJO32_05815 [Bacilli bacterium]|nr:hypothetical protein [Bacilli bacterium]